MPASALRKTLTRPLLRVLPVLVCGLAAVTAVQAGGGGGGSGGGGSGGGGSGGQTPTTRLPTNPPVRLDADLPGDVLLKLRSTEALNGLLTKYSLTLVSRFGQRPIYRTRIIGNAKPKDVARAMALEPDVLIAETNVVHGTPEARANQPWAIGSPGTYATQWAPQALRLAQAHALAKGEGVRVAVLDTGVDASHPLLAGRLLPGRDFVDGDDNPAEGGSLQQAITYGHGTHVAGLVAMVAPAAKIMPLRVLDAQGMGNAWVLAEALLYAADPDGNPATDDGVHVANLSLGSLSRTRVMAAIAHLTSCNDAIPDDPVADQSDPGYNDDKARCANIAGTISGVGMVIVAAAGNDATDSLKAYPAAEGAYGLMAVTASNAAKRLAGFSNHGSWVDVAAPGDAITSAVPGGYGTWSGTSMAAPMAAGAAALVRSIDFTMRPKDVVRRVVRASAMLCGTNLRQVDALGAVTDRTPADFACR